MFQVEIFDSLNVQAHFVFNELKSKLVKSIKIPFYKIINNLLKNLEN